VDDLSNRPQVCLYPPSRETLPLAVRSAINTGAGGTKILAASRPIGRGQSNTRIKANSQQGLTPDRESHSGLPPQTVLNAPGEGGGAHSGLPPQTVFGAFAKSIPKSPN
jgi:hypothetical protein